LSLMTGAAVLAVLWPLSRRPPETMPTFDVDFYRDQLAEIQRDEARGLLSGAEGEAARTEAARRLLRSSAIALPLNPSLGEPALRRRRAVAALALSIMPLLALLVYGVFGSPHTAMNSAPAVPPVAASKPAEPLDMAAAIARVEQHLAAHADDLKGWEILAPIYMQMERYADAARAFQTALTLGGESAQRLSGLGEALVANGGGMVSSDARSAFERAAGIDRGDVRAAYYLALAAEQDGDRDLSRQGFQALLSAAPPNASWRPMVEAKLAELDSAPQSSSKTISNASPEILAMVESLRARLEASGGGAEDWIRLIRSYMVMGQGDKALAALQHAHLGLKNDAVAWSKVETAARGFGLPEQVSSR